jgi:hypothetical protein
VLQWDRYKITSECQLIAGGPLSARAGPGFCAATLAKPADAGGLGLNATAAGSYCTLLTSCGFPCGAPTSPGCSEALAAVGGAKLAGAVPSGEKEALCGPGVGGCPAYDAYRKVELFWGNKHEKQVEEDFKRADSLLFNAFIFSQARVGA